jgi:hypothetical protein
MEQQSFTSKLGEWLKTAKTVTLSWLAVFAMMLGGKLVNLSHYLNSGAAKQAVITKTEHAAEEVISHNPETKSDVDKALDYIKNRRGGGGGRSGQTAINYGAKKACEGPDAAMTKACSERRAHPNHAATSVKTLATLPVELLAKEWKRETPLVPKKQSSKISASATPQPKPTTQFDLAKFTTSLCASPEYKNLKMCRPSKAPRRKPANKPSPDWSKILKELEAYQPAQKGL